MIMKLCYLFVLLFFLSPFFDTLGQEKNTSISNLASPEAKPFRIDSTLHTDYIQRKISFKNTYPFVDYTKNYIEWENYTAISHFLNKLKNTSNEKIKIFHIGDSHIQADMYPAEVREKLHDTFGSGGRGTIFPYAAARTHAGTDYVTFAKGRWDYAKNVQWLPKFDLGLSGITIQTRDSRASFMLRFKDESLNKSSHILKIYCKKSPKSFDLELLMSGFEDVIHVDCNDTNDNLPYVTVHLPEGAGDVLQISVAKNEAEQYFFECNGIVIEKAENKGVMYNCAGVNGAGFRSLARQNLLPEHLTELKPDLVVIDLGINDFFPLKKLQESNLESTIRTFINTVRTASPESSILLLSVQEACHKNKALASTQEFSEMVRRIAFEMDCAFYDFYEISGSKNSMHTWQKNGLAKRDFLHLTSEGYQHKGELLANAILNAYNLTLTKKDSLQRFTLKDAQRLDTTYQNMMFVNYKKEDFDSKQMEVMISTDAGNIYESVKKTQQNTKIYHKVIQGESLGKIALKFRTTVSKLQTWNQLKSTAIRKGQVLVIYKGNAYQEEHQLLALKMQQKAQQGRKNQTKIILAKHTPMTVLPANPAIYKVRYGDSLWSIAKKHHITVELLKLLNNLTTNDLSLGQALRLK